MTSSLKKIVRNLQAQGIRVDLVQPGSDKALPTLKPESPTLGEIVAQIAQPTPTPALQRPDAEQERWAGGLAASFNRLSNAIDSLAPEVKTAAQTLLNTVKSVQTLCAEVQINNARIGKVSHELDNVSEQIDAYARMKRLGIGTQEDSAALAKVFSVKAASIAERFVEDLRHCC